MAGSIGDHTIRGTLGHGCSSPRPKITKTPLAEIRKNSRLIIGCDGLWDVATSKEVVEAKNDATGLMRAAYRAGSKDNISVMTVDLSGILQNF
jgi:serine/threonine protein phosphatase PrpC